MLGAFADDKEDTWDIEDMLACLFLYVLRLPSDEVGDATSEWGCNLGEFGDDDGPITLTFARNLVRDDKPWEVLPIIFDGEGERDMTAASPKRFGVPLNGGARFAGFFPTLIFALLLIFARGLFVGVVDGVYCGV